MTRDLPNTWSRAPVAELFERLKTGPKKDARTVSPDGTVPVLDQSADSVFGYHEGAPGITASADSPVVTFSNHRCYVRLIRYPFSVIQNVIPMRPREGIDARFFYYSVVGRTPVTEYKGHWPEFLLLSVNVPPIDEQRRIAGVLGALDDKIALNRKMNQTLEETAQAIFKSWFIDFDGVDASELVDSELGPIPKGWEVVGLKEAAEFRSGKTIKRSERGSGGTPVFGANGIIGRTAKSPTAEPCTVLGKIGSCGALHRAWSACWVSNNAFAVLPGRLIGRELVWHYLSFVDFNQYIGGSANPYMPLKNFGHHSIPVGPVAIQQRFESVAGTLSARQEANLEESRTLAELRDTLLPKLMCGQLRVPEAEARVEAAL